MNDPLPSITRSHLLRFNLVFGVTHDASLISAIFVGTRLVFILALNAWYSKETGQFSDDVHSTAVQLLTHTIDTVVAY
jgi:hypothetical protein